MAEQDTPIIPLNESRRFITECMEAVGTPNEHARALADILVEADYRGHYSHGMNRLEMYFNEVKSKSTDPKAVPTIIQEGPATAWVDGNNALGVIVGNFCMDLAIKKAKEVGVGWVTAKNSNHFGIAGWYPMRAVKQGLLGICFSNTSCVMSPTRSKDAALGTNPLSVGAPATCGDSFLLDMATTAVSFGKIEMALRKGTPIPEGWAQDTEGHITTDALVAAKSARLMPLGGAEVNSGYKGTGLALMVEAFCGILGGSAFGPNIVARESGKKRDLGQTYIAVDTSRFAPDFDCRMTEIMNYIRSMEPVDPSKPVLVAGDPEKMHMVQVNKDGGVRYVKDQLDTCARLSKEMNVKPLQGL